VGALVDHSDAFHFHGYNAVPPGHAITGVRIGWGDGTTSIGSAQALAKPFTHGCIETVFTGQHRYTRVRCEAGVCSTLYQVTVSYRDARTDARHTLRKLRVDILRPEKPVTRPAQTSTTTGSTIGRRLRRS
jgi:hypothetical protein